MKFLKDTDIKNKTVIIRVDYNVPMEDGEITNTKKIDDTFETLDYLIENDAKIIILSHFGRVKTEEDKEKNSLKPIFDYIKSLKKYNILFSGEVMGPMLDNIVKNLEPKQMVLVENTRFMDLSGNLESSCDIQLSEYWASLADVYIDDAFGSMHRNHASITGIPKFLPSTLGFLAENEIKHLKPLITNPEQPFVVLMGGSKLTDKIELIYSLAEIADKILLGGGIANTFLKALDYNVGSSLVSNEALDKAVSILQEFPDKIVLPVDTITSPTYNNSTYEVKELNEILEDDVIGDIGPKTIAKYKGVLEEAKTIFVNGAVGMYEQKPFANGTSEVLRIISNTDASKIIGGGDASTTVKKYQLESKMTFISTGGGSTLYYIANRTLPGLEVITKSEENTSQS